jgi:septal ring factor EnvC (AmiA/AmiB activator)
MMPRAASAGAQVQASDQRLREQRDSLERIRREREELERQANALRTQAHGLTDEVRLLDERAATTARLVRALERQLMLIADEVDSATTNVARAESELASKHGALRRHAVEIYKRGPLFTAEALLSARSFGELVARYKYLHTLTLRDQALVRRVEELRNEVALQRDRLVTLQSQLELSRNDKAREESRLIQQRRDHAAALRGVQQRQKQVEERIAARNRAIAQLEGMIASLDAARRRAPTGAARASSIRTSDYGQLDWPVDGELLYTFGRAQTASNTTIRWNGVGIAAAENTPVRAIAPGTVVSVGRLSTYGLMVIVDHGGGDYSVYGSLARSDVKTGQSVTKGQVLGGVGVADADLPAHLHFEIRSGARVPVAVDPATWLRARR